MEWVARKWRWANQNRLFWTNVALALVCVLVIFMWRSPNGGDFRVRTLGMVLQLIGVLTVWFDLTVTAREFGKVGVFRRTWRWLKAGFGRGTVITGVGSAVVRAMVGRVRAKVRNPMNSSAPLDDRVTALEKLAGQIDNDLDNAFKEIDAREAALDEKLKAEAVERTRAVADVKRRLESATAGNYPVLLFGAIWLAVGVFLATWAPEIAKIVDGQWAEVRKAI